MNREGAKVNYLLFWTTFAMALQSMWHYAWEMVAFGIETIAVLLVAVAMDASAAAVDYSWRQSLDSHKSAQWRNGLDAVAEHEMSSNRSLWILLDPFSLCILDFILQKFRSGDLWGFCLWFIHTLVVLVFDLANFKQWKLVKFLTSQKWRATRKNIRNNNNEWRWLPPLKAPINWSNVRMNHQHLLHGNQLRWHSCAWLYSIR